MYTVEQLFTFMKENDASDLYITVGRPPCFRISGSVRPAGNVVLTPEMTQDLANALMTPEQREEFKQKKEQNLAVAMRELGSRFRVNLYVQQGCTAMVIRKIESKIKCLEDLGVPEVLSTISMEKRGLVLVVGATGSGKSTTLAGMIDYRNSNEAGHIITIEDPVEFVHEHKKCVVSQREVGSDTDSFKAALKNTLRQAPTVILIGEIRDEETMMHALEFAETGHLCLGTLHSNNANQAIERIMNFFPPVQQKQIYLQLSLNMKAIISQRLVKSADGKRAPAIEILRGSARVRELIRKGEITMLKEAMEQGEVEGMQTFDRALFNLHMEGRILLEEALSNADSPTDLKLKIKIAKSKNTGEKILEGNSGFTIDGDDAPEEELEASAEGEQEEMEGEEGYEEEYSEEEYESEEYEEEEYSEEEYEEEGEEEEEEELDEDEVSA